MPFDGLARCEPSLRLTHGEIGILNFKTAPDNYFIGLPGEDLAYTYRRT